MSNERSIPSEIKVEYDFNTPPAEVLLKASRGVGAVSETNLEAAKILGIEGRFINRLKGMRNGSVIAELEFYIDSTFKTQVKLDGVQEFIYIYIQMIQKVIYETDILKREDLLGLRENISVFAAKTDAKIIQSYYIPNESDLAKQILDYQDVVDDFNSNENCSYISEYGQIRFSKNKVTSSENNSQILTKDTVNRIGRQLVVIRRPDLLGSTMWEVKYKGRTVKMVIMDIEWLMTFKEKRLPISTGSALDVDLKEKDEIGFDGAILDTKYYITKVHGLT